jgi:hypothetical protein
MQQFVHILKQDPHLGFNAKVKQLQQRKTTRQGLPLKGMLPLRSRRTSGASQLAMHWLHETPNVSN